MNLIVKRSLCHVRGICNGIDAYSFVSFAIEESVSTLQNMFAGFGRISPHAPKHTEE